MVKKLSFKKILITVGLAAVLFFATTGLAYPANVSKSASLSFGWQPTPEPNTCEFEDDGWPLLSSRRDDHSECEVTDVNHLAGVLDWVIILGFYILLATLLVYGAGPVKERLDTK